MVHPDFVVYIDEEIIIYDEDSETILNYRVIVEEAKFSLSGLIDVWRDPK